MHTIYIYHNKITGKKYVGQTVNPEQRKRSHKHEALSGKFNYYFHKSIRKHGWNNFTYFNLHENIETQQEANKLETEAIQKYNTVWPNGYNQLKDGFSLDQKAIDKMKITKKQQWQDLSEEEKQKKLDILKTAMLGKSQSQHQRDTIRKLRQKSYIVTYPNGKQETITNLTEFCRTHNLIHGQANLSGGRGYRGYQANLI